MRKQYKTLAFLFLLFFILINQDAFSQEKYKIISIDSIPGENFYVIKIKNKKDTLSLLSKNENKIIEGKTTKLKVGKKLKLTLTEVSEENEPYRNSPNIRGHIYYIDGIKIDHTYYSSPCIQSLFYLKNCR